ncbi:MAG: DUF1540 domain-containing protein [Clostridia bacterium]|nr:DUF1540 domain-containing protein [Clostridia bacterium]
MVKYNSNIKCDVRNCKHNCEGKNCCLDAVKITCGKQSCTICGDYSVKEIF